MLDKDVTMVNTNGLVNLDVDVAFLSNHAERLGDSNLATVFAELRQVSMRSRPQLEFDTVVCVRLTSSASSSPSRASHDRRSRSS